MSNFIDRDQIASLVKEIERKTDAEIVPCLTDWSDPYPSAGHRLGLILALLFYASVLMVNRHFPYEIPEVLSLFVGYFAGLLLINFSWLKRLMVSNNEMDEESRQRAMELFFKEGIHQANHRLGVLIYVAWKEHRIHILADSGLSEKINKETWERLIATFVHELKKGKVDMALKGLVNTCGDLLAGHFPKSAASKEDNHGQLKNDLR